MSGPSSNAVDQKRGVQFGVEAQSDVNPKGKPGISSGNMIERAPLDDIEALTLPEEETVVIQSHVKRRPTPKAPTDEVMIELNQMKTLMIETAAKVDMLQSTMNECLRLLTLQTKTMPYLTTGRPEVKREGGPFDFRPM